MLGNLSKFDVLFLSCGIVFINVVLFVVLLWLIKLWFDGVGILSEFDVKFWISIWKDKVRGLKSFIVGCKYVWE